MKATFAFVISACIVFGSKAAKKPNILFLVVDDLRPALGSYDYHAVKSPNIDQLASQSVVFNNAHCQQAVCGPSRVSLLTGRRPDTTRLYDFGSYWRTHAGNYTTLPEHLKNNGYFTYSIGKIFHPGISSNFTDDYPYSWSEPVYHPPTTKYGSKAVCPMPDGSLAFNILCPVDVAKQPGKSLPDIQSSERAIEVLKNLSNGEKDKPFFLAVGFHKPHVPFRFPKDYLKLYPVEDIELAPNPYVPIKLPPVAYSPWTWIRRREDLKALNVSFPWGPMPAEFQYKFRQHYYSAVSYTDSLVGRVLNQLQESGFADDTIIVLFADHGWSLGEHGEWCKHENLEIVTRVPLMVHVPGVTNSGSKFNFVNVFDKTTASKKPRHRSHALVELVDLFPTLSELAGLKVPKPCPLNSFGVSLCTEGLSFAPVIKDVVSKKGRKVNDEKEWKSAIFSQYPRPADYPQENSELPSLVDIKIMGYTMRTKNHRYTEWVGFDPVKFYSNFSDVHARELYLRDQDPDETNNVADDPMFQTLAADLRQKLLAGWRKAMP